MGIQICSDKGAGPFWGPISGKIRKIWINLQKLFFSSTTGQNALIFGVDHWSKEIQFCSNEVARVM